MHIYTVHHRVFHGHSFPTIKDWRLHPTPYTAMDDVFKDAMKQIFREASPDLTQGFKKKMGFIQDQDKHRKSTVQKCLDGMSETPPLLELLVAAYVVNGGIFFKHGESETEDLEYKELLEEMEGLNLPPPPRARSTTDPTSPDSLAAEEF
jgi:hypothetical protein